MNKIVIIIAVILIVVIGGYFVFRGEQTAPESAVPAPGQEQVLEKVVVPSEIEELLPEQETTDAKPVVEEIEPPEEPEESLAPLVKEISMTSGNLFFSPKTLTLAKDQPVKITFRNSGTHTFTVRALGVNAPISGSSATVLFTPTQSGTFEYYCAVPGHRSGGMLGSLTVE